MDPQKEIERVLKAEPYKEWQAENKKAYLCSFFCMQDKDMEEDNIWNVCFYNPTNDKITSFTLPVDKRKTAELLEKDAKVFKQPGERVEKLKINKVAFTSKAALDIAITFLKENHPTEFVHKEILLLQYNQEVKKQVWNITLMTTALNMFNAKIDATSGEVLAHFLRSALELRKELQKN